MMNGRDIYVALLLLIGTLASACVGKELLVSQELRKVLDQPTPTAKPTVSINVFAGAVETACQNTVDWWNSDPSDDGDIPLRMVDQCTDALIEEWCDEVNCTWPGPQAGWAISDAHEAAQTAWGILGKDNQLLIGLGNEFINHFKEELGFQRLNLEITQ